MLTRKRPLVILSQLIVMVIAVFIFIINQSSAKNSDHSASSLATEGNPLVLQTNRKQAQSTTNLILNGGFESADANWNEIASPDCGHSWIGNWLTLTLIEPYQGDKAFLAGYKCDFDFTSNSVEQLITVPVDGGIFSFWYYAQRETPDAAPNNDWAYVTVDNTEIWHLELVSANSSQGWQNVQIDFAAYAGQQVAIKLGAVTENPGYGWILFDEIKLLQPEILLTQDPEYRLVGNGDDVEITGILTNPGETDLNNISVTNSTLTVCDQPALGDLAANTSISFNCLVTNVSQNFTNTMTVQAVGPLGGVVVDSATAVIEVSAPSIKILVTPENQTISTGNTAVFSVFIQNIGNVPLANVQLTADQAPNCNWSSQAPLSVGEIVTYDCVRQGNSEDIIANFNVQAEDPLGTAVFDTDNATVDVISPEISLNITPEIQTALQNTANFTVTLANSGDTDLTNIQVTSNEFAGCATSFGTLSVGETETYTCTSSISASILGEMTAVATDPLGLQHSSSDTAYVDLASADITLIKSPSTQTLLVGETAAFTIFVINSNTSLDLTDVTVTDSHAANCNNDTIDLLPADSYVSYTCTLENVSAAFSSITTASATNPLDNSTVTDSDYAVVELLDMQVSIIPATPNLPEPAPSIEFTIFIENSGSKDLTISSLTSNLLGDITAASSSIASSNCTTGIQITANGGLYSCSFIADIADQPGSYEVNVNAMATDDESRQLSAANLTTVTVDDVPSSLALSLTPSLATVPATGEEVTFQAILTNTSTVDTLTVDTLSDKFLGNLHQVGTCTLPQTLAPGELYQCSYSTPVFGLHGDVQEWEVSTTVTDDDNSTFTMSAAADIQITAPAFYETYLPAILHNPIYGEPNDTCTDAIRLETNYTYNFLPDDNLDWYWFDMPTSGNLTIQLTDFVPIQGQMAIYHGNNCSSLVVKGNNGTPGTDKSVNLGYQPPGQYYILVINDGPFNSSDNYRLYIDTP